MKKSLFSILLLASLFTLSCSEDDVIDALGVGPLSLTPLGDLSSSLNCAEGVIALDELQDQDDPSCTEIINILEEIKSDCGDEDGDIQELIEFYEDECND